VTRKKGVVADLSVLLPFMPVRPEDAAPFGELVRRGAAGRLWAGQSLGIEPHAALAHLAGLGLTIPMGSSVTLMPLRHPFEAALQARSVAVLSGQPFVAGLGPGAAPMVASLRGKPFRSPLTAVREYAETFRGLLAGGPVARDGEYVVMRGSLPPIPHPGVLLGLGVLRPQMAALAGELADVAITWLAPPRYLAEVVVPALERQARRHGRVRPRLVAVVQVCLAGPGRDPIGWLLGSIRGHLSSPHYQEMLALAGVPVAPDDLRGTTRRLLAAGGVACGTAADIGRILDSYREAGVDEIALSAIGVHNRLGPEAALGDLRTVLDLREAADVGRREAGRE
jgi:5,10-methylenetetrahydromethanopterin reductase